ncbi:MAG TPA: GNAT family N-acetyltransferase [Halococcus sp.]|nr:GNAT family N-acetyltransferase [Halococcus sp.]
MPTYQSVSDERIDDYMEMLRYAFRPTEAPETYETIEELPGPAKVGVGRGLFEDGELLCTCAHNWFTVGVRGAEHPLAGLSAVATPPENRRQGLITQLLLESLREYREREYYLSALWPFGYPFYRRYGWAQAGTYASYECDPDALAFAAKAVEGGEFRRLDADEFERLNPVLNGHNEAVALSMRRSEEWWRHRVFEGWERDPYVYSFERDGELRGYLVYTIEEDDERTMEVHELVPRDHEAYVNLIRFCHYHDSQVETVKLYGRTDTLLFDLIEDPRAIEYEVTPGGMVRIVDVATALSALDYPIEEGRIVLSVRDPLADWNDGMFAVEIDGGEAACNSVDERPDATVSIPTLSQLFVGHCSVERATIIGDCSIESENARKLLDAMFPPQEVFLREGF